MLVTLLLLLFIIDPYCLQEYFSKMAVTPYEFYPHSTSFVLSSLLLLYLLFYEWHWIVIISEVKLRK